MNEIARNTLKNDLTDRSFNNQEGSHMSNKKVPKEKENKKKTKK